MAKAPTNTNTTEARKPVTETGVALLALLAANGGTMMLTQAEGQDIIGAGDATVDTTKTEGDTAAVTLTDAGRAKVDAGNNTSATSAPVSGNFAIDDDVPPPTGTTGRGRSSGYPFDALKVNQSFHVPKTKDNEDPAGRLASSVSGARDKYAEDTGETKTVKVKNYKKDADGKFVKDAAGKRIFEGETEETRPVKKVTRDFKVATVGADDPKGEGARVWRIA